jgi:hypothetical protein
MGTQSAEAHKATFGSRQITMVIALASPLACPFRLSEKEIWSEVTAPRVANPSATNRT